MHRVNRRNFLRSAAALVVGCRQSTAAVRKPGVDPKVCFGFSLYGMRSLKVLDAIRACAKIGYDCVELVASEGWPCDPAQLTKRSRRDIRNQLRDGLALPSLMENLHVVASRQQHTKNLDRLKAACELGHDLALEKPPLIETILGSRPADWENIKGKMVDGLKDWARVAEQGKTIIAIKAHVGGALHTPEGAKWLVHEVDSPWIKLTYDYSHFQLRNYSLEKSLTTMSSDTVFIHVKDARGRVGNFRFLLPGDGNIDYAAYFKLLRRCNYKGAVVVEVSGQIHGKPGYKPIEAAKHSYTNLAPTLTKAGLRNSK